jgi:hypothetical protein
MTAVWMSAPPSQERRSVSPIAVAPRAGAATFFKEPPYVPTAVRTGWLMTTSVAGISLFLWLVRRSGSGRVFVEGARHCTEGLGRFGRAVVE